MTTETPATPETPAPAPRFRRLKKFLKVAAIAAIVLLAVGRMALPAIIRKAAESNLTTLLGQETKVADVSLSLLGGSATVTSLTVANAPGFGSGPLADVSVSANIGLASLLSDTVVIESVEVRQKAALEVSAAGKQSVEPIRTKLAQKGEEGGAGEEGSGEQQQEGGNESQPAETKGILVKSFVIRDLEYRVKDEYAADQPLLAIAKIAELSVTDLYVPPSSKKVESAIATVELKNLELRGADRFSKPAFLTIPSIKVRIDVGRILATRDNPVIQVVEYLQPGTSLVSEDLEKPQDQPQNVREFSFAMQNATDPEGAKKLPPPKKKEKEKEEKRDDGKGILGGLFGKKDKEGEAKADPPPAPEPAPQQQPPAEEKKQAFERILVDVATISDLRLERIVANEPKESFAITGTYLDVRDLTYPYAPGKLSTITLRAHPFAESAKLAVKLYGEITSTAPERDIRIEIDGQDLPLDRTPQFNKGLLSMKGQIHLVNKVASGTITFKFRDVEPSRDNMKNYLMLQPLVALSAVNAPELTVPFSVPLEKGTWKEFFSRVGMAVFNGLLTSIGDAGKLLKDGVGAAAGAVQDVGKGAVDTAGGAVDGAGKAAGKAIDAVGGLFGGKKDGDKKDDAEEKK